MRYRLGLFSWKSRQKAQSRKRLESSREIAACLKLNFELPVRVGVVRVFQQTSLFRHLRSSRSRRVQHELVEFGIVGHGKARFQT